MKNLLYKGFNCSIYNENGQDDFAYKKMPDDYVMNNSIVMEVKLSKSKTYTIVYDIDTLKLLSFNYNIK